MPHFTEEEVVSNPAIPAMTVREYLRRVYNIPVGIDLVDLLMARPVPNNAPQGLSDVERKKKIVAALDGRTDLSAGSVTVIRGPKGPFILVSESLRKERYIPKHNGAVPEGISPLDNSNFRRVVETGGLSIPSITRGVFYHTPPQITFRDLITGGKESLENGLDYLLGRVLDAKGEPVYLTVSITRVSKKQYSIEEWQTIVSQIEAHNRALFLIATQQYYKRAQQLFLDHKKNKETPGAIVDECAQRLVQATLASDITAIQRDERLMASGSEPYWEKLVAEIAAFEAASTPSQKGGPAKTRVAAQCAERVIAMILDMTEHVKVALIDASQVLAATKDDYPVTFPGKDGDIKIFKAAAKDIAGGWEQLKGYCREFSVDLSAAPVSPRSFMFPSVGTPAVVAQHADDVKEAAPAPQ